MPQREVELILARQLASRLAVPVVLVDAGGDTLFFNEPAEAIVGRPFDEVDALSLEERTRRMAPRRRDGRLVPTNQLPSVVAMIRRRPAHSSFHLTGLDGVLHAVQATAIPIESARGQVLGALIVLWPDTTPSGTGPDG
jgi:PAS domain-containing protein